MFRNIKLFQSCSREPDRKPRVHLCFRVVRSRLRSHQPRCVRVEQCSQVERPENLHDHALHLSERCQTFMFPPLPPCIGWTHFCIERKVQPHTYQNGPGLDSALTRNKQATKLQCLTRSSACDQGWIKPTPPSLLVYSSGRHCLSRSVTPCIQFPN